MGIRLDWEIETEREHVPNLGEDPEASRARWRQRGRGLLLILFIGCVISIVAGVLFFRLRQVDAQIESVLRSTVDAEVASLRVGDRETFMSIQRSASQEWLIHQQAEFEYYQALKVADSVVLSGRILDSSVDGQRGRVRIEEIVEGAPFARVWFYWRYEEGWRHVPPDYTFWGDLVTVDQERLTLRYRTFDEPFVATVNARIAGWLATACAALGCTAEDRLTVEIAPQTGESVSWMADGETLFIASPYIDAARLDRLFSDEAQMTAATLIAERWVNQRLEGRTPLYPADAYYLRQAVISWLVGQFLERETNSHLIRSIANSQGEEAVGRLLATLQPNSDVRALQSVIGVPLDQSSLDWRDFLTWRLRLETDSIAANDGAALAALYAPDAESQGLAATRLAGGGVEMLNIVSVAAGRAPDGTSILNTLAQRSGDPTSIEIQFQLIDGVWKRAN